MVPKSSHIDDFLYYAHVSERITDHDLEFIGELIAGMKKAQPFMAASMMEFSSGLNPLESEDVLMLYLVVWAVYSRHQVCTQHSIILGQYEDKRKKNMGMFSYLNEENDSRLFSDIVRMDFDKLGEPALMQYIANCFQIRPALVEMDPLDVSISFISLKSFIECFEEIVASAKNEK